MRHLFLLLFILFSEQAFGSYLVKLTWNTKNQNMKFECVREEHFSASEGAITILRVEQKLYLSESSCVSQMELYQKKASSLVIIFDVLRDDHLCVNLYQKETQYFDKEKYRQVSSKAFTDTRSCDSAQDGFDEKLEGTEEERRLAIIDEYVKKYSENRDYADAAKEKKILKGMPKELALLSWGFPASSKQDYPDPYRALEVMKYNKNRSISLENEKVIKWKE